MNVGCPALAFSIFSLETGSHTEPGVQLAASKPQQFLCLLPKALGLQVHSYGVGGGRHLKFNLYQECRVGILYCAFC